MARNITLVIHALHGGGAERIAAEMANHWSRQGDRVTVVTLDTVESDVYRTDLEVDRIGLGLMQVSRRPWQAVRNNLGRLRAMRQAILSGSPHCVVSLTDRMNIMTLLSCRPLDVPVIIAEHSDPRRQQLGYVWERLRRHSYPECAAAVVLTQPVAEYLKSIVADRPIHIIPNAAREMASVPDNEQQRLPTVLAMGRLSQEKGFDLLIQAFSRLTARFPDWRLHILGEGPQGKELKRLTAGLQLADRVEFRGWVDQPERDLAAAGMFVLSSRYEGFPVALLEAMACGLPPVSFDCDSGPREIIRHEEDGLLVPPEDVAALAAAMERLMQEPGLRKTLGDQARHVAQRFSVPAFFERWERVLTEAMGLP